jgi:hypothetical protein
LDWEATKTDIAKVNEAMELTQISHWQPTLVITKVLVAVHVL